MNEILLSVLVSLSEEVFPRETFKNEHGVYLHTWVLSVYDDGKGSYLHIYLACKNGIWGSVSTASGKTRGYTGPLWDGDFVHTTLDEALVSAWEEFDRVEERFHEKPKFYEKALYFMRAFMPLSVPEKIRQFKVRD